MMRIFLLLVLLNLPILGNAQVSYDTLRVLNYNLLVYGMNPGCNLTCKNTALKTIIDYVNPDIFGVQEISGTDSERNVNSLLTNVLNTGGRTVWQRTTWVNSGFQPLCNTLFYRGDKLALKSETFVNTEQRDINVYILYYKHDQLAFTRDTTFIRVCVAHLKAGEQPEDADLRKRMADDVMNYLNSQPVIKNTILMGDLNVYSSDELAYRAFTQHTFLPIRLYDPINMPGAWSNNRNFAAIHTQSTRVIRESDQGVTGGCDDRFDFILTTEAMLNNSDKVRYIPGSYTALGNNGNIFNRAVTDNRDLPQSLIQALYRMSDHLPVFADFSITLPPLQNRCRMTARALAEPNTICAGQRATLRGTTSNSVGNVTAVWNPGNLSGATVTVTPTQTTTYTLTVRDGNNCVASSTATVTVNPLPAISVDPANPLLCGNQTSITLTASGAVTYNWLPAGQVRPSDGARVSVSPTVNTTYTVIGTSGAGCQNTATVTVQRNSPININVQTTPTTCATCATGTITISPSGGTPPFSFQLDNSRPQTNNLFFNLQARTYTVSVIDANGCSNSVQVRIEVQAPINCSMTSGINFVNINNNDVTVRFDAVSAATAYQVTYRPVTGGDWFAQTTTTNSARITGLNPGTRYEVRIRTLCGTTASSALTNPVTFTTTGTFVCSSPAPVMVDPRRTSVNVSWMNIQNATQYELRYRPRPTPDTWTTLLFNQPTFSYNIVNLRANTPYQVQVRARCNNRWTSWAQASFTTLANRESDPEKPVTGFHVYPNPVTDVLIVILETTASLKLVDISGKVVLHQNLEAGQQTINLQAINSGLYLLINETSGQTVRIVKQ